MEEYSNEFQNENSPKNKLLNEKNLILTKKEFKNMNEEHILSLRKKKNTKQNEILKKIYSSPQVLSHDIDIKKLIPLIENDPLYMQYNSDEKETENEKLGYLFQMLLSENLNILKYSLIELKSYLNNINNANKFISKNLLNEFNEKMFRFLFNLLFKNKNSFTNVRDYYQVTILVCYIISKLCLLNEFYVDIVFDYFTNLLNLAQKEEDKNLKNSIYIITNKILFKDNKNLEKIYPNYFNQIYNELTQLINESINNKNILILKDLYPTLIGIINIIILNKVQNINNNYLIDNKKICNLISLIKYFLDISFMGTEILKSTLYFLSISLKYFKKNNIEKELENEFKTIINNIRLDKHIISYINDNSIDDNDFKFEVIEIINYMLILNDSDFLNNLIENNICEQISNLQDYLLENDSNENSNIMAPLYKAHIDLIYNLISTQSEKAIQNICIDNSCISNLFQFINNSTFLYNNDNYKIIEIFDLLIQSKAEFVHNLLLSERIYDLYKNILNNNKDNNLLLIILKDFSIMIERGKAYKTSKGINYISNHFLKNGILEVINNLKSRDNLNNEIIFLLDEITKLLEEKTLQ